MDQGATFWARASLTVFIEFPLVDAVLARLIKLIRRLSIEGLGPFASQLAGEDHPLFPPSLPFPLLIQYWLFCRDFSAPRPVMMLWTAPPPARECHGCGCC